MTANSMPPSHWSFSAFGHNQPPISARCLTARPLILDELATLQLRSKRPSPIKSVSILWLENMTDEEKAEYEPNC